jgi:hypothetical protein
MTVAGSSVASGRAPGPEPGACEELLGRALIPAGDIVVFSDAYYSYLLRQPACEGWSTARATGLPVVGSSVVSGRSLVVEYGACEELLGRALIPAGDIVVFSDAYYSYLLRQPACEGWSATTQP